MNGVLWLVLALATAGWASRMLRRGRLPSGADPVVLAATLVGLATLLALTVLDLPSLLPPSWATAAPLRSLLLHVALGWILFSTGLQVEWQDFRGQAGVACLLAGATVTGTLLVVGLGAWSTAALLGLSLPLPAALALGAALAPTDARGVRAWLDGNPLPPSTGSKLSAEAAIGAALAMILLQSMPRLLGASDDPTVGPGVAPGMGAVLAGLVVGGLLGWLAARRNRTDPEPVRAVLVGLVLVAGVLVLADPGGLHLPTCLLTAGACLANAAGGRWSSQSLGRQVRATWAAGEGALVLLGAGAAGVVLAQSSAPLAQALLACVVLALVVAARALAILGLQSVLARHRRLPPGACAQLIWGGRRGGLCLFMALSLAAAVPGSAAPILASAGLLCAASGAGRLLLPRRLPGPTRKPESAVAALS